MTYDPQRHHRRSIRLKGYDYSRPGAYYVTICAQNRECLFGGIVDGRTQLFDPGKILVKWWDAIPNHFPNVKLDEYVVMPNHMHGIIFIVEEMSNVGRGEMTSPLPKHRHKPTLGQIMGYLQYQCTKEINQLFGTPGAKVLHRNYYEHIVQNENELNRIRRYIIENPMKRE